ncbi:MAG TPA: hypothetical protein VM939_07985 [Gemmatimonadaceae bacterium]|nr:hypothetical protein [Gemmatimonadaceae bacterium]
MHRAFSSPNYQWMSARSRNASRRLAIMGIVGGFVFVGALIAFVLVPREATKVAVTVTARLEERPDSTRTVAIRNRAAVEIASADSMLSLARRVVAPPQAPVVDTFPPELRAQRETIAAVVVSLNRLIERADNAPLPSSYRALAMVPAMGSDPQVQALLDSLTEIERERDAFGTVGGVDPVYVALTSRATAIGRSIQSIAEVKRATARAQLALLRPPASASAPQARVDTARYLAQRARSQQSYVSAVRTLAQMKATNDRIDRESSKARDLANVGAPPLAMLAAALVLALSLGFATAFVIELKNPTVFDTREAEQVSGVRVLSVIEPPEMIGERSRRQADVSAPPLIDIVSDSYRRLYLHLAATEANIPIVTVAGDDAGIVATIASNIGAAAAYEARGVLLVDVDPTTSAVSHVFRIASNPGLAGIVAGSADWPEAIVHTAIGRDRWLDVLPSGTKRIGAPSEETAERVRGDFARMERRYDLIVIAAPTAYMQRSGASIIPGPDIVLCARIGHTRITHLRSAVEGLRQLNLRIHGLVLWNDDLPVIEAHDEPAQPKRSNKSDKSALVGAR